MIKLMKTKKVFLMNKVITIILSIQLLLKVEEEKKKHKSSEMEISENIDAAAAAAENGLIQQTSGRADKQHFPVMENEDSVR